MAFTKGNRMKFTADKGKNALLPTPHSLFLAAALLIACAAAWPLMSQVGLINTRGGGDSPFLLQRVYDLTTALADGHFPVRWMPTANYGYGYPFFNFYAPLAFYVAAAYHFLGFGLIRAIQLSQLTAFLLAAGGMFTLGRRWFNDDWAGLLASAAYTLAPFHLVNVYVRGDSIAEFWAMAFYPLTLLAVEHIVQKSHTNIPWPKLLLSAWPLALSYAGLVVSHNISALIFSPFLLLYTLFTLVQNRQIQWARFMAYAAAAVLALLLSAWFWLPALSEQSNTQLGAVTEGYFHYSQHFRTTNLLQTSFFFDFGTTQLQAFRMGLLQTVGLFCGVLALGWGKFSGRVPLSTSLLIILGMGLALATLMMTPWSGGLWQHLPLLSFTQFPWRFLSVQALWAAGLTAGVGLFRPGKLGWLFPAGLLFLLLLSSLGQLRPHFLTLTNPDVTPERLAQYEWFTGNIGTTISAEYLPPAARPRPVSSAWLTTGQRWQPTVLMGQATAVLTSQKTTQQVWQFDIKSETSTVILPLLHWNGWQASTSTGQAIELQPAPDSGLVQLTLPQGSHNLTLQLIRPFSRWLAELISLLALVVVGLMIYLAPPTLPVRPLTLRSAFALTLLLTLLVVWGRGAQTSLNPDTLTWDFGEMGYLHHNLTGIAFENGAVLDHYTLSAEELTAGQTLTLTLHWQQLPPPEAQLTVTLFTPAVFRYPAVQPFAQTTLNPLTQVTEMKLTIDAQAPAGLVVPLLTWQPTSRPVAQNGQPRGDLALRPVRITAAPLLLPTPPPQLTVQPLAVTYQPANHSLALKLAWFTPQPIAENLALAVRLAKVDGTPLYNTHFDVQPGYGFNPSRLWPAGQWVADWLTLPLPADLPAEPTLTLLVTAYDTSGRAWLTRRLGNVVRQGDGFVFEPIQPTFTAPENIKPAPALFAQNGQPVIKLLGYTHTHTENQLEVTLYWQALAPIPADFHHFVHLLDPQTGQPVAQHDAMPQENSYPTSQWTAGEVVADKAVILLEAVPAGEYKIVVGLYEVQGESYPRLEISGADQPTPHNALPLTQITHSKQD